MTINTKPHIHNLVMCANVFVRKDGKYLLLKRSADKKYAPNHVHPIGGKIDPDENPYAGGKRELLEEAGITVKNMRLEAVIMEINPVKDEEENWLIFHFSGDYDSGKVTTTEEGELILIDTHDIAKQDLFPSVRPVIEHILSPKDGTAFLTVAYDDNGEIIEESKKLDICAV